MTELQKCARAFEYAQITMASARISNDIVNLISNILCNELPNNDLKILQEASDILKKYHYEHTFSSFQKQIFNS